MTTQLAQSHYHGALTQKIAPKRTVRFFDYCSPIVSQCHFLIDAIRQVKNARLWVTLIDPPFLPKKGYLTMLGLGHFSIRVVRLKGMSTVEKQHCLEQCVLNGKSSLVAIWSTSKTEIPAILNDDGLETPLCQTLVFENQTSRHEQLEMEF
ncbi:hypothetical protein QWZ13_12125 [Reinekea marina]|uniref:Cell division inhibitor SulA n=1 Tax=Reinekea marina TaxID=1310421 RepID=A0ABV7WTB6_9GAMM|nr:hypothetical protein [Reinekea marina]MBU2865234.1 hypothetical protein [Reinekea forsetii]MDN3649661.1 hypothetical protein [Reinekea marina]